MKKKIVVIGGGTGSVAVLSGLKDFADLELSVIVSMTDNGGSNAVIRDEFGLLPLSDVRKSIIALSDSDEEGDVLLRKIFTYRFNNGTGLKGHTIGNLIMMGLSDITGSEANAIQSLSRLFHVKGKVIPVTFDHVNLLAEYNDGSRAKSEHVIDEPVFNEDKRIVKLSLDKPAKANPEAIKGIEKADFILLGPGDLYTTTLANVIVKGIAKAIKKSKGKLVLINNLMTKRGQTHWMSSKNIVGEIEKYCDRKPDLVLVNSASIPKQILNIYKKEGEKVLKDDFLKEDFIIVRSDLISGKIEKDSGDILKRSLVRHDPHKLARELYKIFIK